jgi:PAS domain S-box-containing protein
MPPVTKKPAAYSLKRQQLKSVQADYLREKDSQLEREKELIVRISRIFNSEARLKDCLNLVLKELCLYTGRQVAEVWLSSIDHKELRLTSHHISKGMLQSQPEKMEYPSAKGLIGKAWKEKQRVEGDGMQTDKDFGRQTFTRINSLISGTAIPVLLKNEVIAVLAFYVNPEAHHQFPIILGENVIAQLASDIKRKKLEEELFQFFSLSPDLLGMAGLDGFFKKVNPGFMQVLGYTEEEFLSKPLIEFVHPFDREIVTKEMKRLSEGNSVHSFEVRFITKEKGTKWITWSGSFLPDEDLLFGVGKDITEKKELEISMKESEERFRVIFEQAAVGVAMLNSTTGQLLRVNKKYCDIFGYTHEELNQLTFMEITYPDDLEADLENMRRLCHGEIREFSMEKRHFRKDGSIIWVNLSVSPMWRVGESPTTHIAIVQDITDRKVAEEKIRVTHLKAI